METVDFHVNERYSKVANWFSKNFDLVLIKTEVDDIICSLVDLGNDDYNIIQFFHYEYDIVMSDDQLHELKELIKTIK